MYTMNPNRLFGIVLVAEVIIVVKAHTVSDFDNLSSQRQPRKIGNPFDRGESLNFSMCNTVGDVPDQVRSHLALDQFYQKYTHAYGIPIISSSRVLSKALYRACYVVQALLADRKDVRDAIYDNHGRIAVIGTTELTTDIPEHQFLDDSYNDRARGLGATPRIPVTSVSEENLLCYGSLQDKWYDEDLLVHELAHGIHLIGMNKVNPTWQSRLQQAFDRAMTENLWQSTYATTNIKEYFAEGVQKFFNVDTHRNVVDGIHNNISTRATLKEYDKGLFDLVSEVFPCANDIVKRCQDQDLIGNTVLQVECTQLDPSTTVSLSVTVTTGAVTEQQRSSSPYTNLRNGRLPISTEAVWNGAWHSCISFEIIMIWIFSTVTLSFQLGI